jgi:TldD protein
MRSLVPALAEAVTLLERVAPYASGYARKNSGTAVRIDRASTTVTPIDPQAGFTMTAWTGDRFLEISSDDPCPEAVRACALALADRARAAGAEPTRPGPTPGEPLEQHFAHPQARDSRTVPAAEKVAAAESLRAALAVAPHLREAVALLGDVHAEISFVNRTRRLSQELHRVRQVAVATFASAAGQVQLHHGLERIGGWERLEDPARVVESVVRDGPRLLGVGRIPDPGEQECVIDGHFAGLLAHEAFGHGTEQDLFLKDRAQGAEHLGKPIAAPGVSMYDDPSNGWAASYFFDDEGILATRTAIVENGILINGLNDRHSHTVINARGQAVGKTANGRREAYDHKPYTRMTNTFFGAGQDAESDLIRGVKRGYYLTHPSNGMEDPKGWGIQCEGAMAEEILDGRLTGRVFGPVVVTGHVPTLLKSITGIGSTVHEASLGMCGKGYKEWVKVTDGGPALRLRLVIA